jgi:hypothetical protein
MGHLAVAVVGLGEVPFDVGGVDDLGPPGWGPIADFGDGVSNGPNARTSTWATSAGSLVGYFVPGVGHASRQDALTVGESIRSGELGIGDGLRVASLIVEVVPGVGGVKNLGRVGMASDMVSGGRLGMRSVASKGAGAVVKHNPINPGPLSEAVASTFRGGSYTANTVGDTTRLYRVYGGTAGELGGYWTRTKPTGAMGAQIDLALKPQWGNTATKVATIDVPAGTTIFEGAAASQGGLVGGGSQVFIPAVDAAWIVR